MPQTPRRTRRLLSLALLAFVSLGAPAAAQERAGTLSGRVTDANGNPLPGARVHVEPRGLDATTSSEGRFALSGLPAGPVTVEISCVGFTSEKKEVALTAGRDTSLDAHLQLDFSVSETVTVTTSRSRGEVEALNQQKSAPNLLNVLPAEIITSLPNTNVADAIGRLPSVSLERDEGEGKYVQIRGTEPRLSNFEINGVHIPSPEASVRNLKLDVIPSDLVGSIELHKTLSADQDGDAIGGSINLITKTPGDQPYWSLGGQGGYTTILGHRTLYEGNGTYATRFGEDKRAGLLLGGGYDWNGRGINDIEPSVGTADAGQGPIPVFSALDLREYRYERSRYGLTGAFDYRLDPASTFYVRGLLADFKNYGDRWVVSPAAGSFLTPTTTDDTGSLGRTVQNRRPHEQIYSLSTGGDHTWGDVLLDTTLAYSHSQQNRLNQLEADFAGPGAVAFRVDGNPYFPQFTPTNGVDVNDPRLYTLDTWRVSNARTSGYDLAGALNLSFSHRLGSDDGVLKAGLKLRDEHKDSSNRDRFFSTTGAPLLRLDSFLDPLRDPGYYRDRYALGPLPSLDAVARFLAAHPEALAENLGQNHQRNDPNNFTAKEQVAAGYVMETLKLQRASLDFGVRVERTSADYTGFKVLSDAKGQYVSTTPVGGSNSYTDALPSLNLRYEIDPRTNFRLAYGRGLSRPNFADLPPFLVENDRRGTLSAGNPNLKPTHSNNYDLLLERYLTTVGYVSLGAFYKDLRDPIYRVQTGVTAGPFAGFTQSQPINGERANISGVEASWQQHLSFLPGALKDLGVLANYTYTRSQAKVPGRNDDPALLRTTPKELNFGLTYDRGAFSARAAVTYNDAYIWQYNFTPGADLGLRGPNGDVYLYPHTQFDAQASYTVSHLGLQILANVLNINNEVFGFYQGSPRYPIQREFYGRSFSLGFRLTR